jgi:hypothetical protein
MIENFALDQGTWLTRIEDIQMHGGVCHAMATEWVYALLQQRPWDANTEYFRGVSHQRAYALKWADALRGLWGGAAYDRYLQIAAPPTENFVRDPARRQGRVFRVAHEQTLPRLAPHVVGLGVGSGLVIVMFGVDINEPADSQNWGHTVAIFRDVHGDYKFLDVNQGEYSWPADTPIATVGNEVVQNLTEEYGTWGIRDINIFGVG